MNTPLEGNSDCHEVDRYIDIPEGAVALGFGVNLIGEGTVWIDDAAIEILEPIPATEAALTPVIAHNRPPLLNRMTAPDNLAFEE